MVLVQDIGMSGYVPLEGAVVLRRFVMDYDSGTFEKEFHYLGDVDMRKSSDLNILHRVIFFAIIRLFDDFARFTIVRDIGLLSGYYYAGVVFPRDLLGVFKSVMGLENYLNLYFFSSHPGHRFARSVCTTAWAEYICVDFIDPGRSIPYFLIEMLGRFEIPISNLRCDGLRNALSQ